MSEITLFIKKNVMHLQSIKKSDSFETVNY